WPDRPRSRAFHPLAVLLLPESTLRRVPLPQHPPAIARGLQRRLLEQEEDALERLIAFAPHAIRDCQIVRAIGRFEPIREQDRLAGVVRPARIAMRQEAFGQPFPQRAADPGALSL